MRKRLTQKTCLLLTILSLAVCLFAYECIWFFLPQVDRRREQKGLKEQAEQLVSELRVTEKCEGEALFLDFIRETGAGLWLIDERGRSMPFYSLYREDIEPFGYGSSGYRKSDGYHLYQEDRKRFGSKTGSEEPVGNEEPDTDDVIRYPFKFADADDEYLLAVRYDPSRSKEITAAMIRSLPLVAAAAMLLSFVSAWLFSRHMTRPIMRINQIAGRMAQLDFSWYCPDVREDEIGMLSKSINELSDKLHEALQELHRRNTRLEDEIQIEKERERRRMLFFSGISHELKTPIAIVIGQLEGMQAGIGVYKDREKYLARSTEILQSLNEFLKEILLVSHMDLSEEKEEAVNLSRLTAALLREYADYAEFLGVELYEDIESELFVCGEELPLKKAIGNIIGNAITHSPEHAVVNVKLACDSGGICLSVSNAPAHIEEEHLPHLFEAFYRADASAEHGSGLGLYITRLILETYGIPHSIKNTADGVLFSVLFSALPQALHLPQSS